MRTIVGSCLALVLTAAAAEGQITTNRMCLIDETPSATLLLPYFEVDFLDPLGVTTLISINNAYSEAVLTNVTLWTNWAQPTYNFNLYLTGYDVATINLRDIFNGNIPITADFPNDPSDNISPQGPRSEDAAFPNCNNFFPFYSNPMIAGANLERLQDGHTGQPISGIGERCLGGSVGDFVARGYITVDNVSLCNSAVAFDAGYFVDGGGGIANNNNELWGDYFIVDEGNNFAFGESLVNIHADGEFNAASTPTGYTFYGRYSGINGLDNREPLGSTWGTRFLNGGAFNGGTDMIVWRDTTAANHPNNGFVCATGPNWFPLNETEVVAFNEQEDAVGICDGLGGVTSPPQAGDPACFGYATGRYELGEGNLVVPYAFGWVITNLNLPTDSPTGDIDYGATGHIAQSYVAATHSASGRFQVGLQSLELTLACEDVNPLISPP